jgi:hypothetical protein
LTFAIKQRNFAIAAKAGMIINEVNMRLLYILAHDMHLVWIFLVSGNEAKLIIESNMDFY